MSLGVRVAVLAALSMVLSACGGGSSDDRRGAPSGGGPAPIVAESSTRAAAQKLADRADERLVADGTGRYELTWGTGRLETREIGDYSIGEFLARTTKAAPSEDTNFTTEIIYIGAEAFGRSYVSGRPEGCWGHVSRGEGADARTLAYPKPVILVFEPRARGFAKGGDGSDVVVDLVLRNVLSAVLPSFARAHRGDLSDASTVPARLTIVNGVYRSLSFRMIDVLRGLEDAGLELKAGNDIPPRAFDDLPKAVVHVEYTRGGADVDIKRPPPENVNELDGVPLGGEPEPCAKPPRS